jgi:TFIIF-interacting CTD phosphatase-like protein
MFKVRANRDNNFIIITDLFDCNNRDIRSFNKSSERKKYFCENPETHYLSDNKITDEFGMKVTIVHPKLAIVITNWIYKNNDCDEKDQILNFIKYFVDKV